LGYNLTRVAFWTTIVVLSVPVMLVLLYRVVPPPITPLMLIRAIQGEGITTEWVPLRRISRHAVMAVISLEDSRFCAHSGIDWNEMSDALSDYFGGRGLRGASTIGMQTAKNLFLWPGRDIVRKILEAPLTILLELTWDKSRILEVYLNIAEWGPGVYGIEAASRRYFHKAASRLTPREAGLLAAVLPNPRRWSPNRQTRYLQDRVNTSLARAATLGNAARCATPGRRK
jgi:monofunctional biosynthetic peptidoglycan transglycosylase